MLGHVVREPFAGDGVPVLRLSPPVLPADLVDRPRCHADVEESTCTVVTAPAGYGKSTLVASWAASAAWPVAWATLDAYDDGLRLLRLLVAALGRSVRVLAEPLAALGDALRGGRRDVAAGVDELLSVLDVLDAPAHLVLDDVHELPTSSLRGVLGPLVRYRPEALRLVLVSRYDAVLPLHRLRLSGRLHEVRSDRLAFTVAEVAQLAGHVRAGVDAATVRRLHAVTGGWPVAVRLALAAPGAGDLGERLTRAEAAAVPLTGYFVEEVLDGLPPRLRTFVLRASAAGTVDPVLAAALAPDGAAALEECVHRGLFLTARTSDGSASYTWHALFAAHARITYERTDPAGAAQAHRVVAAHVRVADPVAAVTHALAAGDPGLAVEILAERWPDLLVRGDAQVVERLVARIPVAVGDSPDLQVALAASRAYLAAPAGRWTADAPAAGAVRHLVELFVGDRRPPLPQAVAAGRALVDGGPLPPATRALGLYLLGRAEVHEPTSGGEAIGLLEEGAALAGAHEWPGVRVGCLAESSLALLAAGATSAAEERATDALDETRRRGWRRTSVTGTASLTLGIAAHWRDDLTAGAAHLTDAAAAAAPTRPDVVLHAAVFLAVTALAAGDAATLARAHALLDGPRTGQVLPTHLPDLIDVLHAHELDVRGDLDGAVEAVRARPAAARHPLARCWEADLLLRAGDRAGAQRALGALRGRQARHVEVLALLVRAAASQGDAAHTLLERALQVGAPEGAVRAFLQEPLRPLLLEHLGWNGGHDAFVARVLARFDVAPRLTRAGWDLTARERDVLTCLRSPMTAEEIASSLFVSVNTVKTHQRAVYRKLGVESRREAVRVATSRGIL